MTQLCQDKVETLVGISTYLNPGKSFKCLIKYRFSDFIVNEVTEQKEVVILTDKNLWKQFSEVKERHLSFIQDTEKKVQVNAFEFFKLPSTFEEEAKVILGEDQTEKLLKFLDQIKVQGRFQNFSFKVQLPETKEERVKIHTFIRTHLPFFESSTKNDQNTKKDKKLQKFEEKVQGKEKEDLVDHILIKMNQINFKQFISKLLCKTEGNQQKKRFIHFTLMKRNMDSINAGILLSKFLGISFKHFQMAGIKDKRGITTQRASLQGLTREQIEEVQSRKNWNSNIVVSDYDYRDEGLRLGDLYGNRFVVTLRFVDVMTTPEQWEILKNLENIKNGGFINYFGLQRFGTSKDIKTHDVGREIILSNWKNAFENILRSSCNKDPTLKKALDEYLEDFQHKKFLNQLPYKFRIERSLVQGLENASNNNDYLNAILQLPRNARELYGHAYQSYLWNLTASRRVELYGNVIMEGDLVNKGDFKEELVDELDEPAEEVVEECEQIQVNEPANKDAQVILVTANNKKDYTLSDVVIPLFGSQTDLHQNSICKDILEKILANEGVTKEHFMKLSQNFIIKGGYRKLVSMPENFQHELVSFTSKDQDIINPFDLQPTDDKEGVMKALIIKFTLKKSSYATMLFRELTKSSSSLDFQQELMELYNKQ